MIMCNKWKYNTGKQEKNTYADYGYICVCMYIKNVVRC